MLFFRQLANFYGIRFFLRFFHDSLGIATLSQTVNFQILTRKSLNSTIVVSDLVHIRYPEKVVLS